jgi:hypothetical protein
MEASAGSLVAAAKGKAVKYQTLMVQLENATRRQAHVPSWQQQEPRTLPRIGSV